MSFRSCSSHSRVLLLLPVAVLLLLTPAAHAAAPDLPRAASPEAEGINPAALAQLVRGAQESRSSALVILKNGKWVGEWSFGPAPTLIHAMSVTKPIAGLAILKLLGDGKIPSLDEPVFHYFPEWNQGRKKEITLRHLLTHTSGLQAEPTALEIYASPDVVKLALAAELTDPPGTIWRYNNKAVNLLGAIVQKVSGQRLDQYLAQEIFRPLGITDFQWDLDSAGNPHVMAGLHIRPRDLAKLGQLMLDGGVWQGRRILSAEWVKRATQPGEEPASSIGLLWFIDYAWMKYRVDDALLTSWKEAGVSAPVIQAVSTLKGKTFQDRESVRAALRSLDSEGSPITPALGKEVERRGLKVVQSEVGPVFAFQHSGYLGQYLYVIPEHKLVAVRMYDAPGDIAQPPPPGGPTDFADFMTRARALPKSEATGTRTPAPSDSTPAR